jgi:ACT domain-containing protein
MPTLDGGTQNYLQLELASISQSIKTIVAEITKINAILTAHGLS